MVRMFVTSDELGVNIGFHRIKISPVIFGGGKERQVKSKSAVTPAQEALGNNRPGIGMTKNPGVFLKSRRKTGDCPDLVISLAVSGAVQNHTVFGNQALIYTVHGCPAFFQICRLRKYRPGLAVDKDLRLPAFTAAQFPAAVKISAEKPFTVPGVSIQILLDYAPALFKNPRILFVSSPLRQFNKFFQRTVIEKSAPNAFALTLQINAVVPVGRQAQQKAVGTAFIPGKLKRPAEMLVNCSLTPVGKRHVFLEKSKIAGFLKISGNRQQEPEMIVGKNPSRFRHIMGPLPPVQGLDTVHGIPLGRLTFKKSNQFLPDQTRDGMNHPQSILVGITVTQTVPAPGLIE